MHNQYVEILSSLLQAAALAGLAIKLIFGLKQKPSISILGIICVVILLAADQALSLISQLWFVTACIEITAGVILTFSLWFSREQILALVTLSELQTPLKRAAKIDSELQHTRQLTDKLGEALAVIKSSDKAINE